MDNQSSGYAPIFVDTNVSPSYYTKANPLPGRLIVRTMFATIQGEGPLAGQPAVFIRLGGCNLGDKKWCIFCDTDFLISKSQIMTFAEIHFRAAILTKDLKHSRDGSLFVITGGEPMLQPQLSEFILTTTWRCQIETNGMFWRGPRLPSKTFLVVSPKVAGNIYFKPRKEVLDAATCLKFVIDSNPDSIYHTVPDYAFNFMGIVYVSPIAVYKRAMTAEEGERADAWDDTLIDRERTRANYQYAATYALQNGFRLSIQQHLFAAMP